MRVSVVIPTYNSGPLVVEAISSVLAQTAPPDQILVVDDGSTDDTASRLSNFAGRIQYIRQPNGGVSSARNRGVAEASGDVIAFLDADDVWHPRKLELQMRTFATHPDLGLLGTATYRWPTVTHPEPPAGLTAPTLFSFTEFVERNRLVTSTVIARTETLREAGPFDTNLQGPETTISGFGSLARQPPASNRCG